MTGSSVGSYSSKRGLVGFVRPFARGPFMKDFKKAQQCWSRSSEGHVIAD